VSDEFPFEIDPDFGRDEPDDLDCTPRLTKKQRKAQRRLRRQKEREAAAAQRHAVVILSWDREDHALSIEHPFVSFPEAAGIVQMADATVRECIENGGMPA
jgi:hypothetical protein